MFVVALNSETVVRLDLTYHVRAKGLIKTPCIFHIYSFIFE